MWSGGANASAVVQTRLSEMAKTGACGGERQEERSERSVLMEIEYRVLVFIPTSIYITVELSVNYI
jgi:hypothetical protein